MISLTANETGGGELTVSRDDGRRIARLYARTDHDGELDLYDEHAVLRANVGGNSDGGYCNFWNRAGDTAVYIGADGGAETGYLALFGPSVRDGLAVYTHHHDHEHNLHGDVSGGHRHEGAADA